MKKKHTLPIHSFSELHYAIVNQNVGKLRELIAKGADIHQLSPLGMTPLHMAAEVANTEIIDLLIKQGARPNAQGKSGTTALHIACYAQRSAQERLEAVKHLVQGRADINLANDQGFVPLHTACEYNCLDVVKLLILEHKVNVNAKNLGGITPLHSALEKGNRRIVEFLLAQPTIDVNAKTVNGNTPLHFAIMFSSDSALQERLLKAGANIHDPLRLNKENRHLFSSCGLNVDPSKNSLSPLELSVFIKRDDLIPLLLDAEINMADASTDAKHLSIALRTVVENNYTNHLIRLLDKIPSLVNAPIEQGKTPLEYAVLGKHFAMVQVLLERGADPNLKNNDGNSPFFLACGLSTPQIVTLLLGKNADIRTRAIFEETVLHAAAALQDGSEEVTTLLLNRNADPSARKEDGYTPLHTACQMGHLETVRRLIKAGVSPGVVTPNDVTPLYVAASHGHVPIMEMLKNEYHVTLTHRTLFDRSSALHVACAQGQMGAVKFLMEHEGKTLINEKTVQGYTPLFMAVLRGDADIVDYLLERGADIRIINENNEEAEGVALINKHGEIFNRLHLEHALLDAHALPLENAWSLIKERVEGTSPTPPSERQIAKIADILMEKLAANDDLAKQDDGYYHIKTEWFKVKNGGKGDFRVTDEAMKAAQAASKDWLRGRFLQKNGVSLAECSQYFLEQLYQRSPEAAEKREKDVREKAAVEERKAFETKLYGFVQELRQIPREFYRTVTQLTKKTTSLGELIAASETKQEQAQGAKGGWVNALPGNRKRATEFRNNNAVPDYEELLAPECVQERIGMIQRKAGKRKFEQAEREIQRYQQELWQVIQWTDRVKQSIPEAEQLEKQLESDVEKLNTRLNVNAARIQQEQQQHRAVQQEIQQQHEEREARLFREIDALERQAQQLEQVLAKERAQETALAPQPAINPARVHAHQHQVENPDLLEKRLARLQAFYAGYVKEEKAFTFPSHEEKAECYLTLLETCRQLQNVHHDFKKMGITLAHDYRLVFTENAMVTHTDKALIKAAGAVVAHARNTAEGRNVAMPHNPILNNHFRAKHGQKPEHYLEDIRTFGAKLHGKTAEQVVVSQELRACVVFIREAITKAVEARRLPSGPLSQTIFRDFRNAIAHNNEQYNAKELGQSLAKLPQVMDKARQALAVQLPQVGQQL